MADNENPPLTPRQELVAELTEAVTAFVELNPKVDIEKVRRFLGVIETGDAEIDRELRRAAAIVVLFALAKPYLRAESAAGSRRYRYHEMAPHRFN
jgi:hypothetical protein